MKQHLHGVASLLEDLAIVGRDASVIAIGLAGDEIPGVRPVQSYDTLSRPDELPATLRVQLAIVRSPLDFMSRQDAEQLLSRLRDVHSEKVLLLDTNSGWTPNELRALGYLELERASAKGRCYLFDPDFFNEPREWNNARNWANPENFRKYRW